MEGSTTIKAGVSDSTQSVLRSLWITVAIALVVLFFGAIPAHYREMQAPFDPANPQLLQLTPFEVNRLADFGISLPFYAAYHVVVHVAFAATFIALAVLLFTRRPDEPIVLFISMTLILFGIEFVPVISSLVQVNPFWATVKRILNTMTYIVTVLVVYVFPDGRFTPRWTALFCWGWAAWMVVGLFVPIVNPWDYPVPTGLAVMVIPLSIGLWSQYYRFRNIASPEERQQSKWVMMGIGVIIGSALTFVLLDAILPSILGPEMVNLFMNMVWLPLMSGIIAVGFAWTLGLALLRHRLWDVDYVLNRSLVYGAVTVLLVLAFLIGFFTLRVVLSATLNQSQAVAALISTAVVFGLYSPVQRAARRFVDRQIYGIKVSYTKPRGATPEDGDTKTLLGPYELLERIGRGGMADVYRAYQKQLNRTVAIKVLHHPDDEVHLRFEREARTIAALTHRNIVQVYDFGSENGQPFMVMEYVNGPTLEQVVRDQGALPYTQVKGIVNELAQALDYAHENGVIHRDVKAGNVMLRGAEAVLADFGVAKIIGGSTVQTQAGIIGTLEYIAPEQIRGEQLDHRVDIYALGVLSYYCLSGLMPFKSDNPGALLIAHLQRPAPDPRDQQPNIPAKTALAIMQAMAKTPDARYKTAQDFALAWE
ncbi:MAG: serine/threonine protein kinase [Chloroflexi bacterium]|nr:serine/threonine protein kinase [Chloroflexota bacterium]